MSEPAPTETSTTDVAPTVRWWSGLASLLLLAFASAVLVAAGLAALSQAGPIAALGLPEQDELTGYALPIARTVAQLAAALTVGGLLLAAFLVPPQRSGYLDVTGYRAVQAASWAAALWAAAALLMVPLTVAEASGRGLGEVLSPARLYGAVPQLSQAQAWTFTAAIALVVLAGCRLVLSWGWTVALLGIAVVGLTPLAATGHSSAGGSHDIATDSLLVHTVAAAFWVGGLVAVLALAGGRTPAGPDQTRMLPVAVRRFSRLALVCWVAMAITGVVNALVRTQPTELLRTGYGGLVLAKAAALILLGYLGYLHRRRSVGAIAAGGRGALLRFGTAEVLVMFATIALAVALGRTPPPQADGAALTRSGALIGYDLDGPPTALRLLSDGRFDLIFGSAALLAAAIYLLGVRRLRRRGDPWPVGRTIAWLGGCLTLLVATSSGVGRYAPAMFSIHMVEHMLLSMVAPILLVLGAPMTLALRGLPVSGRSGVPGPREWLLAAVHSRALRWLTHPLLTLPLFVGSYYALYFSGLFDAAVSSHWAHLLMNAHFVVVGLLFFWPLVGIDPAPRRLAPVARLGVAFASLPFHAFFAVALMSSATVIGQEFYGALALPWVPDLLADQKLGAGLAWASGELPMLLVMIALVVQWRRTDERAARRSDRRADADGEADLAAYNSMLSRLAATDRGQSK